MIIKNIRVLDPVKNVDTITDLVIDDEISLPKINEKVFDGSGYIATPSLIDIHTHFREPGFEDSETIETGIDAAIKGGFSLVVTMPNTNPACFTEEQVQYQIQKAKKYKNGFVEIQPSACCTIERKGVTPVIPKEIPSASCFTDDGSYVSSYDAMRDIVTNAGLCNKIVMDHAVDSSNNLDGVIRDCKLASDASLKIFHDAAECDAVARDIEIARATNFSVHIQHISCKKALDLIKEARSSGVKITAEATPHHLSFSTTDIIEDDSNFKMNPPLGTADDVEALRNAVLNGDIHCFATDHAPHSIKRKTGGFNNAAFGIIGLETAAPATWTVMVKECGMEPLEWIKKWTTVPASLINHCVPSVLEDYGVKITIFKEEEFKFTQKDIASKSSNTPFIGYKFNLKVIGVTKTSAKKV